MLDIELKVCIMDNIIMNIKEIVQIPYTTNPRFTPIDSVKFKDYLQEAFEERLNEYNTLLGDMSFESAVEKKLVKKTSEAMNNFSRWFFSQNLMQTL